MEDEREALRAALAFPEPPFTSEPRRLRRTPRMPARAQGNGNGSYPATQPHGSAALTDAADRLTRSLDALVQRAGRLDHTNRDAAVLLEMVTATVEQMATWVDAMVGRVERHQPRIK